MHGAIADGVRVPAVTVFGWDDVLCPTTHAKLGHRRAARAYGVPGPAGSDERAATERKQVSANYPTRTVVVRGHKMYALVRSDQRFFLHVCHEASQHRGLGNTEEAVAPAHKGSVGMFHPALRAPS